MDRNSSLVGNVKIFSPQFLLLVLQKRFMVNYCTKKVWVSTANFPLKFSPFLFLLYPVPLVLSALDVCCTFNACSLLLACKLLAYPANTFAWVLCLILSSLSAEKEPEEPSEETESLWFLRTFWVPSWNSWFTEADWSKAQLQIKAGFSVILTWHLRLPVLFAFLYC